MPPSRGAYQSHTSAIFIACTLMRRWHRKNAANRRSAAFYV